ncbi:endonuclease/exonuclease/phosphatase family protein [Hypoxylon rubiginosum]|uniref:Endonuclease/exonuclease/phosphatase family protein n=1 Tax=Hypoxylon rubiginosum TaxID=110542 RepID=A0ACC0DBN5_9PEZI|nr:endonuclease/exonuclease/phosphatase family protein [Hypoxylon rubiginosum]
MDARVQKAIQLAEALKKQPGAVPWQPDKPWPQRYYSWDTEDEAWLPVSSNTTNSVAKMPSDISALAVYSWNVDLMLPFAESRMEAALAHLGQLLSQASSASTTAVVINLQECVPSDLITISRQPWVRDGFYMTDLDASAWGSWAYGTTTLVDKRLDVLSCFRVHYAKSNMERDALFVDVSMPVARSTRAQTLRLGNSHLESLISDPPLRPPQVQIMGAYMHEAGVSAAVATGDFNAIQPFDRTLHSDAGVKDAYLEQGGAEDSDGGYTWGQQAGRALRERFGCSRMDKAYFCGSLQLQSFERFGADVEVREEDRKQRDGLLSLGFEKAWVTDHLGIKAVFKFENAVRL